MTVVVVLVLLILALLLAGALVGLAFKLLWLALTGLVVGALARLVLPGRQELGLLATALFGVAGALLGGLLGDAFGAGGLVQFLLGVALAALGIALYAGAGRGRAS